MPAVAGGEVRLVEGAATSLLPQSLNAGPTYLSYVDVTKRFGQGREHMKFVSLLSIALLWGGCDLDFARLSGGEGQHFGAGGGHCEV
jgi:hypothetical protein